MHADVMGLVSGGHTAQEILAAFRAVYGEKALMAPVRSGFNLIGYAMPYVALGTGGVIVAALLKRWRSNARAAAPAEPHRVVATDSEIAAINAAVRRDA
jgi:cytochrome c-type biogenesis protein CcmH/NrfF